jgi:hypothetical protein
VELLGSAPSSEGERELALCYCKGPEDREVRGWVYLKDFNEISEVSSDLMIFTSPARTLRLAAQVRSCTLSVLVRCY